MNVGTGVDISIKELASLIAKIVGYEGQIYWDESTDGTPKKLLDVSRINKLGWLSQIKLGWYKKTIKDINNV